MSRKKHLERPEVLSDDYSTRWGEYDFCEDCKHQIEISVCNNVRHRCNFPISGKRFPKHCGIPERVEIDKMRGGGYTDDGHIEENG